MGYSCDMGHDNPATVLVTILEAGDVLALCGDCFPSWVQATAQAMAETADEQAGGTPDGPAEGSGPSGDPVDTPAAEDTATGPEPDAETTGAHTRVADPDTVTEGQGFEDVPIPFVLSDPAAPAAL